MQAGQIIAAAVFLPLSALMSPAAFQSWGWRIPFLLSAVVVLAGYIIRRRVDETPAFQEESEHGEVPLRRSPRRANSGPNMPRVIVHGADERHPDRGHLFGTAFATQPSYGVGFTTTKYLWSRSSATSSR